MNPRLPTILKIYIALVVALGTAWLALLMAGGSWPLRTLGEICLFILLTVVAGSFPIPVAPNVKSNVTTAVMFSSALVLEPGPASVVGIVGIVGYTFLIRTFRDKSLYPWYKFPFNASAAALYVGLASAVFHTLAQDDSLLTPAVAAAALTMYLVNTVLVATAASLQMGIPFPHFWWIGTKEDGLAEVSLFAFGFLGALSFQQTPWTIIALLVPVAVIYFAFSRLERANAQLGEALKNLEALQTRIANTAKLASIGTMSVDMAHQLKNPLSILLGRLEFLAEHIQGGTPTRRHLDIAIEAGSRIHELTKTFTSISQQKWVPLDMHQLLGEAFGMAGLLSRTRIEARWDYKEGLPKVAGNPVLLREALSNIFNNAMEAVGDRGLITVQVATIGGFVVVSISDNGVGIPQEIMAHLFEPFHSTKPHGSGLGLFATKHILELHRGSVEVESRDGRGTTVTVRLPAGSSEDRLKEVSLKENSDTLRQQRSR